MIQGSIFAMFAAVFWGAAVFQGGLAAKQISSKTSVVLYNLCAFVFFMTLTGFTLELTGSQFLLSMGGGLSYGMGLVTLTYALSKGKAATIVSMSTVTYTLIPFFFSVFIYNEVFPNGIVFIFPILFIGIWYTCQHESKSLKINRTDLFLGLLAGAFFSMYFLFISRVPVDVRQDGFAIMGISSLVFLILVNKKFLEEVKSIKKVGKYVAGFIACELFGTFLFYISLKTGSIAVLPAILSVPDVLTPVILSTIFLGDRLIRKQQIGIAVSLVALVGINLLIL